jgi:hypothetical protein
MARGRVRGAADAKKARAAIESQRVRNAILRHPTAPRGANDTEALSWLRT